MTFFSKAVSKVLPLSCSCSCNKNDPDRISQTNNEKNNHRNVIANGNQQTRSHTRSHTHSNTHSHSYTHTQNHSTTEKEPQNRHHPKKKLIKNNSNSNSNNKPAKKLLSSLWSKNQNPNHTKDAGNQNLMSSLPPCLSAEDLRAGANPNANTNTNTNTDSSHCTTVPNSPSPVVDRSILRPRELLLPVTVVPSLSVPGMPDSDENANGNENGNGEPEPCEELRPRPDAMLDSSSLNNDSPSSNSYNEYSFGYQVDETTTDEDDAPPVPIVWVPEGFVLEPAAGAATCRTYHLLDGPPPLPLASSARKLGGGTARNKDSDRNRNYNQDTDEHWDDQTIATQQSQQHCEPLQEPNSESNSNSNSNSDPTPNQTPNPNHTLSQTPAREEPPIANPDRRLLELAARKVLVAALYQQRPRPVRMPMERPVRVPGGDSGSGGGSSDSGSSVERGPQRPQRVVRWHVVAS